MMKKSITKMLAVGLCAAMVVLTGCGASETTGNTNAAEKTDSAQSEAAPEKNGEKKKVALICDVAGTQVFVLNMIEGLKASAEKYGFEGTCIGAAPRAAGKD